MKVLYQKLWCVAMAMTMCIVGFKAHADVSCLVLNLVDGTSATFPLADNPIIRNTPGELIVESENTAINIAYTELQNFILTDVSKVRECIGEEIHRIIDGNIYFSGLRVGERIIIYSLEGKIMTYATVSYDGTAVIDLSNLGTGTFIARCNNSSFKFINK